VATDTMTELFGEVISSYSRAQALEDGVLVDVSELAKEAGFVFPVAVTQALHSTLTPTAKDKAQGQDFTGRLWDVLYMLSMSIKGALPSRKVNGPGPCQTTFYKLYLVVNGRRKLVELKAVCGPGDELEPVITIMLPLED
jgi:hypothetical protein